MDVDNSVRKTLDGNGCQDAHETGQDDVLASEALDHVTNGSGEGRSIRMIRPPYRAGRDCILAGPFKAGSLLVGDDDDHPIGHVTLVLDFEDASQIGAASADEYCNRDRRHVFEDSLRAPTVTAALKSLQSPGSNGIFVTVTKHRLEVDTECRWCGGKVEQHSTGRPRRYCRDSHRQRAYEARRLGWHMGLDSGEAMVSTEALDILSDRLTILEAALEGVERDLRDSATDQDYRAAFRHLYGAAAGLRGRRPRVRALTRSQWPEGTTI